MIETAMEQAGDAALTAACKTLYHPESLQSEPVEQTIKRYGFAVIQFLRANRVQIYLLRRGQRYASGSPALARLGIDVDLWPAPPAGLFVVEERTVYLRSRNPMTVAHETGHAIDCALGGGVYFSGISPELRQLFAHATSFITPYAATGIDEFLAEAFRAFVEVNDATSYWPRATKARLRKTNPELYELVERLITQEIPVKLTAAA